MGTPFWVFYPDGPEESFTLWEMGNGQADGFRAFTEVIAAHYGLPSAIWDRKYSPGGEYSVKPEPFCALVEAVFADPMDLLSGWAQYASAMYETLKRRRCQWAWEAWPPRPPFQPLYYGPAEQEMTLRLPPGAVRFETAEGKAVAHMTGRRAALFVSIAGFALGDTPSGLSEVAGSVCRVEDEPFSRYVERLVSDPYQNSFYHSWAEHAAGMYEVIRGKWYCWAWPPSIRNSPFLGFTPVRQINLAPTQMSGITLGSPWWTKARPELPQQDIGHDG